MESVEIGIIHAGPLVREGLGDLISKQRGARVIGSFGSAREALGDSFDGPCVLLYDLSTLRHDGLDALGALREENPKAKILIFGVAAEEEAILECVRAGTAGCLLEDVTIDDLMAALRAIAEGTAPVSPRVVTTLFNYVARTQPANDVAPPTPLTPREEQILHLLAEGQNNKQIAERLYLQPQTVKNYVHLVLRKMNLHNRLELIRSLRSARKTG